LYFLKILLSRVLLINVALGNSWRVDIADSKTQVSRVPVLTSSEV